MIKVIENMVSLNRMTVLLDDQGLISGVTLTAGSASALSGFVVCASSVPVLLKFYRSLDMSECDAPADILIIIFTTKLLLYTVNFSFKLHL